MDLKHTESDYKHAHISTANSCTYNVYICYTYSSSNYIYLHSVDSKSKWNLTGNTHHNHKELKSYSVLLSRYGYKTHDGTLPHTPKERTGKVVQIKSAEN